MAVGESWGRFPQATQRVVLPTDRQSPLLLGPGSFLPHGNGRSYGDSCLNDGGTLLHTRQLDHFISFDATRGLLCCEAGVLLADILATTVPRGWFLPVVPGTGTVTLGGAIANDVHGKNHPHAGTFGHHITTLELLRSDGQRLRCSPTENADWFRATVGGLGLSGLIMSAELQLRPVAGPWMTTRTEKFHDLDEYFDIGQRSSGTGEYHVAWLDGFARGTALGRGLFVHADHASKDSVGRSPSGPATLGMPWQPPFTLVRPITQKVFNTLYWRLSPRRTGDRPRHYSSFMFPLDRVGHWNLLYGPRGFLQYQCVLPPDSARHVIREILENCRSHGLMASLAVLKQFGDRPAAGMLSFARQGTTMALDFPNAGNELLVLLERLDDIVAAHGGAVYPAKDARMGGNRFRQYFPEWESFMEFVDPRFSSGFWRRVMAS